MALHLGDVSNYHVLDLIRFVFVTQAEKEEQQALEAKQQKEAETMQQQISQQDWNPTDITMPTTEVADVCTNSLAPSKSLHSHGIIAKFAMRALYIPCYRCVAVP